MPRRTIDQEASTIRGASDWLVALRNHEQTIRDEYRSDPIGLATKLGLKLPRKPVFVMMDLGVITEAEAKEKFGNEDGQILPGLRELVEDVCSLEVRSAVAVASRGGGKSNGVAFVETFLVWLLDFEAINLGGSELQAEAVYSYIEGFIEATPEFKAMVKGDMLRSETNTTKGAWIRVLAASSKSTRSPHAGGRRRIPGSNPPAYRDAGGLLVIDEEAEADPKIVHSALPTVNTARPSVNIRCSTFHNIGGTFEEVLDNAEEMGYTKYHWDIFDICEGCDCGPDGCESTEKCFREDHFEDYTDPDTGQQEKKLVHKAYCGGRARYADGWIPMTEVDALWMRMKRNHGTWEVEAMGSRPTSSGFVIKDRKKIKENTTDRPPSDLYVPGFPVEVCVDWGTVAAAVEVWQEHPGDAHALLHADLVMDAGQTQILGVILGYAQKYTLEFTGVAADIGGGGNYLNPLLRDDYGIPTRDVNFGTDKEAAVAAWNIYNEANKCAYPAEYDDFLVQLKGWKRRNGLIVKKDDHLCDAGVCYFSKFIDRLGVSHLKALPRSFSTNLAHPKELNNPGTGMAVGRGNMMRAPVVRSFGSR